MVTVTEVAIISQPIKPPINQRITYEVGRGNCFGG